MTIPTRIVPEPSTFSATLRMIRERHGLSQSEVGRRCHFSYGHISRLEMDAGNPSARNPTRETVLSIADAMDCDEIETDELLIVGGFAPESDGMREIIAKGMRWRRRQQIKHQAWAEVAGD